MKHLICLMFALLVISCDQLTGPEGPQGEQGLQGDQGMSGEQGSQGETGPAYPQHGLTNVSALVVSTDIEPIYVGINFDTGGRWTGVDLNDTIFYDIIITIDYNYPRQISISGGNNPFTEIYLVNNATGLQGITTIPAQDNKRSVIVYTESGGNIYFMVKNKYSRWAKTKISLQNWDYNPYTWLTDNHYNVWALIEWYYYKDLEPDFSLHKHL